jgi:tetratricopeptide (TPR) repeat protein
LNVSDRVRAGSLIALALCVYVPATRGDFIWDDDLYVIKNAALRSPAGLWDIWLYPESSPQYYPLVFSSFWLEYHVWGLAPLGYHLTNILLHAANAVLFWKLLARIALPGAWLAAAMFVLHPVHVESVAWISERKNVLSMLFYLSSAIIYLRWDGTRRSRPIAPTGMSTRRTSDSRDWTAGILANSATHYWMANALFLAALLSKTVAASLPAAMLVVFWWQRGRITRAELWPLVPMFALALVFARLTTTVERIHVGASGRYFDFSPTDRLLIAGRAFWFYIGKLVWPSRLSFTYPRWTIDSTRAWQYLFPLAAAALSACLWLGRRKLGRGPLAAVLFFAGTLVPALGFFNVYPMRYSFVADHFQYLASLGLIALAATFVVRLWGHSTNPGRQVIAVAIGCALAILGGLTWRQGHVYHDQETLWRSTLVNNPDGYLPNQNLAGMLAARGELTEAAHYYRRALAADSTTDLGGLAYCGLGGVQYELGERAEAVRCFERALSIDARYVLAYKGLAKAAYDEERFDDSIEYLAKAFAIAPNDWELNVNLARLYARMGRAELASRHARQADAIWARSIELGIPQ